MKIIVEKYLHRLYLVLPHVRSVASCRSLDLAEKIPRIDAVLGGIQKMLP